MASDEQCTDFIDWDFDASMISHKEGRQPNTRLTKYYRLCRRKTFSVFVASKKRSSLEERGAQSLWRCCDQIFEDQSAIHKHVASNHKVDIQQLTKSSFECFSSKLVKQAEPQRQQKIDLGDTFAWMPDTSRIDEEQLCSGPGKVLLYYCYCQLEDPHSISAWQKALCERLHLTGKVRVAKEGVNGTVAGTKVATDIYVEAMCTHPLFMMMDQEDFKSSDGGAECFSNLQVGVYNEIVPMGVDPEVISYQLAGIHLEPEEFHSEVKAIMDKGDLCHDTILLDCRNFYESKIGHFSRCLAPNIRKFSYFPDYVDQNLEIFRDKKVLMYCTGGIRCERGSAYLCSKDVCKAVYQLKGGIHKYLERFPEGFYRGKLFVFDERYAISSNNDIVSDCRYCGCPWDEYQLCSTELCSQLVLSCLACRQNGHTACCPSCQIKGCAQNEEFSSASQHKEQCDCTEGRSRIPQEPRKNWSQHSVGKEQ